MLPVSTKENESPSSSLETDKICQRFSLDVIRSATRNFNEELVVGRGGFGKVYKGHIHHRSSVAVAIKRLHSMSNQGAPEFRAEVEMLSKLRHCNLVSLIGYCSEGIEMVLVYDYMPHGTLEDCLHKAGASLTWLQRLKICIGAARGLDYLHTGTGTQHGIIHRDVKSSNILLDENFAAKVSDFGLAKIGPTNQTRTYVSTGVKGTFGYMDPCYFYTGKLTRKSDVYSFGVVLLEILCGRPAVDSSLDEEQWGLAIWAQDRIKEGKLTRIIDSRLKGVSSNCLKQFAHIACRCLKSQPNQRPTMAEIIARLELIISSQERLDSSATEGTFIDKLWSFFPAKVQLKADKKINVTKQFMHVDESSFTADKKINVTKQFMHFDESSFTADEMLQADAEIIGKTCYGTLYLATMKSGEQLMVRRIKTHFIRKEDTIVHKILALEKLCHTHILTLKAYYDENKLLFISDYIMNGSVASFLQSSEQQVTKPTGWPIRMSMIVGITRGLVYLHTQENMVHGYLSSENVMLDYNYNPKISDVGVSMFTEDVILDQSFLNHPPELVKLEDASKESDVYSLGVIMLELLTKKSTYINKNGVNLYAWVMSIPREEWIAKVVDKELLLDESNLNEELVHMVELAMKCVSISPSSRPKADQVLQQLRETSAVAQ